MAFNDQHSNYVSRLKPVGLQGMTALNALFAEARKYRSLGYNPPFPQGGDPAGGQDPITADDFVGENNHLDPDKVFKVVLLAEAIQPLLKASSLAEYDAAAAAMRQLVQVHFGSGGGPLDSIIYRLER